MIRPLRAAAVLVACAASLTGATTASAATLDLVLGGDSYTSGNGAGNPSSDGCYRSPGAWGQLYAGKLRTKGYTVNVTNAACSGGVVKDLEGQLSAITPQTDLVAVTIGGNDVGFKGIVIDCFTPLVNDPARCKSTITKGKSLIPSVKASALDVLQKAKARLRPGAKVIVISYPYLAQPKTYVLRGLLNSFDAGKAVRELGDLGDQAIIDAAAQANASAGANFVSFIPTKDLFATHEPNQDPYAENKDSWIWEFSGFGDVQDIYHPKPAGQEAIATAILRAAGATPDFGVAQ